jgi:hypothetical protein
MVLVTVLFCVNISSSISFAESQKNLSVYINEGYLEINPMPFIKDNRTYLPIRSIAGAFCTQTFWDPSTNTVTIKNRDIELSLIIKSKVASLKKGSEVQSILMDVEPFINDGRTFVPLRFICQAFDCDIEFDEIEKKIDIITNFRMELSQTDYGDEEKEKLYIKGKNDTSEKVLLSDYFIDNVVWSKDNRYACVITCRVVKETKYGVTGFGTLIYHSIHQKKVRLFNVSTGEEIKLENEYFDAKYGERSVRWIDNETVLIRKCRGWPNSKIKDVQYSYNVKSKECKVYDEKDIENTPVQEKSHQIKKGYEMPDKTVSISYIPSLDQTKALFSNNNCEIFLMDLKNNTKEFLFKGIELEWSPKENIARYSIPKQIEYIDRCGSEDFKSEDLETYIYDFRDKSKKKIADFNAKLFFSDDENYIAYVSRNYYSYFLA